MKIITPLIWITLVLSLIFFSQDEQIAGFIFYGLVYGFGIYQTITDQYLTTKEKVFCVLLILVLSIIGVCLSQLYSSKKMKQRFKLNMDIN